MTFIELFRSSLMSEKQFLVCSDVPGGWSPVSRCPTENHDRYSFTCLSSDAHWFRSKLMELRILYPQSGIDIRFRAKLEYILRGIFVLEHMSRPTKLGLAFLRPKQTGRGNPPIYRVLWACSISELREPILIIFDVLESRQLNFAGRVLFMGFVTAWSFNPERFRRKKQ